MWKVSKMWQVSWLFFPFSKKHNSKQIFVNKNLYSHYKLRYWWGCVKNNEIYIKLLNLFQLSRTNNLLYLDFLNSDMSRFIVPQRLDSWIVTHASARHFTVDTVPALNSNDCCSRSSPVVEIEKLFCRPLVVHSIYV